MKKENIFNIVKQVCFVLMAAFVSALSVKLIVQPNKFLSGGVSGLTILISRYVSLKMNNEELESLLYSILYFTFNIPIFIFGFKKLGKQFVGYSVINVLSFSLLVSIIPASWYRSFQINSLDLLTSAIMAGMLSGVASVICFTNGFSQGGTDIISMYLSRTMGKGIGSYSLAINVFILLVGGVVFKDFDSLVYTVIYFFTSSLVVNNLYISHKKTLVEIITKKSDLLTERLMKESHHGCTVIDVVGAYSNENKKLLRLVVSSNQTRRICEIVKEIDGDSFTTLLNVNQVNGKFYIPPLK